MPLIFKRVHLSLFIAGAMLSLFSFLAVHHISSTLPQWEIAAFIFNLAYFSGVSLAYLIPAAKIRTRIEWLMPLALLGQALALFFLRLVYSLLAQTDWIGEDLATAGVFCLFLLLGTPVFAIVLPQAIQTAEMPLHKAYSIELLGSLMGLMLLPALTLFPHTVLLAVYALCFIVLAFSLCHKFLARFAVLIFALGWIAAFHWGDAALSTWYYQQKYSDRGVLSVIETRYTPYHKIEMLQLKNDRKMLVLNGKRQFAEGSHYVYSYFVAELPAHLTVPNPQALVLGCGSMSTVGRLGHIASSIQIVDIDPEVFNTSRKYFQEFNRLDQLTNWTFKPDDAKHFLANDTQQYDLILHDIPPARSRQTALTYTHEFFSLVKARLKSTGIFSISALNSRENTKLYGKKIIATLAHVFDDIVVVLYGDSYYIYSGQNLSQKGSEYYLQATKNNISSTELKWFTKEAEIWLKDDVLRETAGLEPITTNNTGELIFD